MWHNPYLDALCPLKRFSSKPQTFDAFNAPFDKEQLWQCEFMDKHSVGFSWTINWNKNFFFLPTKFHQWLITGSFTKCFGPERVRNAWMKPFYHLYFAFEPEIWWKWASENKKVQLWTSHFTDWLSSSIKLSKSEAKNLSL